MRVLAPYKLFFLLFFSLFLGGNLYAQDGQLNIEQDQKISKLLALKKEVNGDIDTDNVYRIQLYYGGINRANKIQNDFRKKFPGWYSTIKFETPNYKVWVGRYRSRLEADRRLLQVKKKFPTAFLLAP